MESLGQGLQVQGVPWLAPLPLGGSRGTNGEGLILPEPNGHEPSVSFEHQQPLGV